MKIDDWLLDILACPKCHAPLRVDEAASELVCTGADCGARCSGRPATGTGICPLRAASGGLGCHRQSP